MIFPQKNPTGTNRTTTTTATTTTTHTKGKLQKRGVCFVLSSCFLIVPVSGLPLWAIPLDPIAFHTSHGLQQPQFVHKVHELILALPAQFGCLRSLCQLHWRSQWYNPISTTRQNYPKLINILAHPWWQRAALAAAVASWQPPALPAAHRLAELRPWWLASEPAKNAKAKGGRRTLYRGCWGMRIFSSAVWCSITLVSVEFCWYTFINLNLLTPPAMQRVQRKTKECQRDQSQNSDLEKHWHRSRSSTIHVNKREDRNLKSARASVAEATT